MKHRFLWVIGFLVSAGCGTHTSQVESATLTGDVVVRVGDLSIQADLVSRVAGAQHITPRGAAIALADDALAAKGALLRHLDQDEGVALGLRYARVRRLVMQLREDAYAAGPPTDAEMQSVVDLHWREADLPEQVVAIHALVRKPKEGKDDARAQATANTMLKAIQDAPTPEEFEARAKATPHEGLEILVERLPPFVDDGRIVEGNGGMVMPFTNAAFTLHNPGDTTNVVPTEFGWHVIRLIERRPAHIMSNAERRARYAEEVYATRAHDAYQKIITDARKGAITSVTPFAETLMMQFVSEHGNSG